MKHLQLVHHAKEVINSRTVGTNGTVYDSLKERLDDSDAIMAGIRAITYTNYVKIVAPTQRVTVGIPEFMPDMDMIRVYLRGVRLIENEDYTIDKATLEIVSIKPGGFIVGDDIFIECAKVLVGGRAGIGGGGGGGGGGGTPITSLPASNVTLTPSVAGAGNVQGALAAINNIVDAKADATALDDYLPLSGGDVTGTVNVPTPANTDTSQRVANAEFVQNLIGGLNNLDTTDKSSIVAAINELFNRVTPVAGRIEKVTNIVVPVMDVNTVDIGIVDFDPDKEVLDVYYDGVRLVEGTAYDLDKQAKQITCKNGQWKTDHQILFEISRIIN